MMMSGISEKPRKSRHDYDEEARTVTSEEDEKGFSSGLLRKHPNERKMSSERLSTYILVGFIGIMFLTMVPVSIRQNRNRGRESDNVASTPLDNNNPSNPLADGEFSLFGGGGIGTIHHVNPPTDHTVSENDNKLIHCQGSSRAGMTIPEWVQQGFIDSKTLCDPKFDSYRHHPNMNLPLKIFILMGEANMVGAGQVAGNVDGTLEYTVNKKKRFTHLTDMHNNWKGNNKVRYVSVHYDFEVYRNEWLKVQDDGTEDSQFGPELQIGYVLGELYEGPTLLIKACSEHSSLGGNLLPPGSRPYEFGDFKYAGYGDSPRRWPKNMDVKDVSAMPSWQAGMKYDADVSNVRTVLQNLDDYYPGLSAEQKANYEVDGIFFWHGDSDRRDSAYVSRYEENLVQLIQKWRFDFHAPNAKVAIATLGQLGNQMSGNALEILKAQVAVGSSTDIQKAGNSHNHDPSNPKYPQFVGNVATVDVRSSWRTAYKPGHSGDNAHHDITRYGNNAETVMEVGNTLAFAMAKLLHRQ